jgi:hypothetical protein
MKGRFDVNDIKIVEGDLVRIQGRDFMVLGARLRIAHQVFTDRISITTEVIDHEFEQRAVVRARVVTPAGEFTATATASAGRDARLVHCLLEVAEARSVARALRYSGVGVEFVGHPSRSTCRPRASSATDVRTGRRVGPGSSRTPLPHHGPRWPVFCPSGAGARNDHGPARHGPGVSREGQDGVAQGTQGQ